MNLIIVDRDPRHRSRLAFEIPWNDYGIDLAGEASDLQEALKLMEMVKPDIIVSDVSSDESGGLELTRIVRERNYDTRMVLLSSLDSFDLAKRAIELGVSQYLLKPVEKADLLRTVTRLADALRKEREEKNRQLSLQRKWVENLPRLGEIFLRDWIAGKYNRWEIDHYGKEYGVPLEDACQYAACVIEADPIHEDVKIRPQDIPLVPVAILSLLADYYADNPCWVFPDKQGSTVLIFSRPDSVPHNDFMQFVHEAVSELLALIESQVSLTASAGVSERILSKEDVPICYNQAKASLRQRMLYGPNMVLPYHPDDAKSIHLPAETKLSQDLEIALETSDKALAEKTMDELYWSCIENAGSVEAVQENTLMLSSLLVYMIQKQQWSIHEVVKEDYVYFHNLSLLATKEQIRAWLLRTVNNFMAYMRTKRSSSSHRLINSLFKLIEEQIDQELTLNHVADQLFMNSSYLSRLFKQVTGFSFSSYVLERKMQRAKQSLQEGARVYDAAAAVGYRDVSYFTKVFRKFWGVTPREIGHSESDRTE